MKSLLLAVLTALTALAAAETRIACIGDPVRYGGVAGALQKVLGGNFVVRHFDPSAPVSALRSFGANDVVFEFGSDVEALDPKHRDAFEPNLRKQLLDLAGLPAAPKVFLWISDGLPVSGTNSGIAPDYVDIQLPLALQAAREAGANLIIHPRSADPLTLPSSAVAREMAEGIAMSVAPQALKARWRIVRASSFQSDEGEPNHAIDGDPDTFWHSQYDPKLAKPPHELVLDLGSDQWLVGLRYLPRQDGGQNGDVKAYEVYVGDSPMTQATLVAKGSFRNGKFMKTARFQRAVKARYIRFVCLSEQSGGPYASAAEIDIVRDPSKN